MPFVSNGRRPWLRGVFLSVVFFDACAQGLGGLGGLPFVGKTGFKAYSHHVPHDGNLFIVFAPHVGIADDGLIGKISRAG